MKIPTSILKKEGLWVTAVVAVAVLGLAFFFNKAANHCIVTESFEGTVKAFKIIKAKKDSQPRVHAAGLMNPANPASPLNPTNPANPASPLNPGNQEDEKEPRVLVGILVEDDFEGTSYIEKVKLKPEEGKKLDKGDRVKVTHYKEDCLTGKRVGVEVTKSQ